MEGENTEREKWRLSAQRLFRQEQLAEFFKVSKNTISVWRYEKGLPYIRLGNIILVYEPDLVEWILSQKKVASPNK